MSTTAKPLYGTATAMTITLASLGSSGVSGRQSTTIDNTSDLADDSHVFVKATTGTSPTGGNAISIYAFGSTDGTLYSGGLGASDATVSPSPTPINGGLQLLATFTVVSASNTAYSGGPYSIANAFGGTMPRKWGIFIVQNTGAALNATAGNHSVVYTPVQYQNV